MHGYEGDTWHPFFLEKPMGCALIFKEVNQETKKIINSKLTDNTLL